MLTVLTACEHKGSSGPATADTGSTTDTGTTADGGSSTDGGRTDTGPNDGGADTGSPPDTDGDGWADSEDCAPEDAAIHPGADELCNDIDDDCDGWVDDDDPDGVTNGDWWYPDEDEDGYGGTDGVVQTCAQPDGYLDRGGDCNDGRADVSPAQEEVCGDVVDNDCDGTINDCRVDGVFADDELTAATWELTVLDEGLNTSVTGLAVMDRLSGRDEPGVVLASSNQVCGGRVSVLPVDVASGDTESLAAATLSLDSMPSGSACETGLGTALDSADVDGDGYGDLVVSAAYLSLYDDLGNKRESYPGLVFFVAGPVVGGLDLWIDAPRMQGVDSYEALGTDLAIVPDIDGDSVVDFVVAAARVEGSVEPAGDKAVLLFSGPMLDGIDRDDPLATWFGEQPTMDVDIEPAGDLDGDGIEDVAFGDMSEEHVFVLDTALRSDNVLMDAPVVIGDAGSQNTSLGYAIAGEFDLDDDGYDDLLVGAPTTDESSDHAGQAAVFRGPLFGEYQLSDADVLITGTETWGHLGLAVHATDLDGLGGDDIVLGQPCGDYRCETGVSHVLVFYAPEDGSYLQSDADLTIDGRSSFLGVGPILDSIEIDRVTHLLLGASQGHNETDLDPHRPGGELPGTVDLIPLPGW